MSLGLGLRQPCCRFPRSSPAASWLRSPTSRSRKKPPSFHRTFNPWPWLWTAEALLPLSAKQPCCELASLTNIQIKEKAAFFSSDAPQQRAGQQGCHGESGSRAAAVQGILPLTADFLTQSTPPILNTSDNQCHQ
jgi:hypothetical protein